MNNNIFEFATGELTQDAFICWCVNWFNDDSKPKLKELSIELARLFTATEKIETIKISRQFSKDVYIDDKKLALKIDVLLVVNNKIAVIVEDKTYTNEHDNQIKRYKDGIDYLVSNAKEDEDFFALETIRTVFLKTGFMYDEDKCVKSDVVVSNDKFLEILKRYSGESEILDSYISNLENTIQKYEDYGVYEGYKESFDEWNVTRYQIAQYNLMRDIFPEKDFWTDKEKKEYKVYHGTSYGRPWTQMMICERCYENSEDEYAVFWRIDMDTKGPYISLRLYEDFCTKNEELKTRHRNLYEIMSGKVKELIDTGLEFTWEEVYPGYKGNYKESSLIHIKLADKLLNWQGEKDKLIRAVKSLTEDFLNVVDL